MSTASEQPSTPPSDWPGRRADFTEFAADLTARRAEIGPVAVPRNSGKRRTEAKRALLVEIEKLGGDW